MATALTTEQQAHCAFSVKDGRQRTVAVEGTPTVNVSDPSVLSATITAGTDANTWDVLVVALTPSPNDADGNPITQRVTVDADADIGAGVQDVIGFAEFTVSLDPRTGTRVAEMSVGTPEDKPVT